MGDLFSGYRAWFSTSCDEDIVDQWEQHGGTVVIELPVNPSAATEEGQQITHYFTEGYWADDTVQLFKSSIGKQIIILYAHWVSDCVKQHQVLSVRDTLRYIVPPIPLLVPTKPPQLVAASPTPSALSTATLNAHSATAVKAEDHAVAADTITIAAAEQLLPPASAPLQSRIAAAITIDEEREQRYEFKRQQRNLKKRARNAPVAEQMTTIKTEPEPAEHIEVHEDAVIVSSPVKSPVASAHTSPAKSPARPQPPLRTASHSSSGEVEVNRNIWLNHPIMKAKVISLRELLPFPRPQAECWCLPPVGSAAALQVLSREVPAFVKRSARSPSKTTTPVKSPLRKKRR